MAGTAGGREEGPLAGAFSLQSACRPGSVPLDPNNALRCFGDPTGALAPGATAEARFAVSKPAETAIHLGPALPPASSDLPGAVEAGSSMSLLVLLQVGFA